MYSDWCRCTVRRLWRLLASSHLSRRCLQGNNWAHRLIVIQQLWQQGGRRSLVITEMQTSPLTLLLFFCYFLLFTLLFFPPPFRSFPASFPFFCILSLLSCPFIFPYSSPVLRFSLSFLHLCCIRFAQRCSACRFYGIHLHCFINCFIVLSLLLVHTKQSSSGLAVWLWDCDWILEWTGLFCLSRSPRHHSNRWRFDYRVDVPICCHLCPSALHHVSVK